MSSGFNIVISGSKVPITYGAIMNDSDSITTTSTLNIYTSISSLFDAYVPKVDSHNDVNDYFIVMPGYKLIVYKHGYDDSDSSYTIDNTTGTTPFFYRTEGAFNEASSVRLYYKNVELTEFT